MVRKRQAARQRRETSAPAEQAGISMPAPSSPERPTKSVEAVIGAYAVAIDDDTATSDSALDAAVRAYLAWYPETHRDVAIHIVANILYRER